MTLEQLKERARELSLLPTENYRVRFRVSGGYDYGILNFPVLFSVRQGLDATAEWARERPLTELVSMVRA